MRATTRSRSRLAELESRRAYLCRLTPDRALQNLDEAAAFLNERGMLTLTPDSSLPGLFGACHEEPYKPGARGFGSWPRTKYPWTFELARRAAGYAGGPRASRSRVARGPMTPSRSLVIRGGTLVPMSEARRSLEADLLVEGTRIAQIGRVEVLPGAAVIDASGCYVLPGFVQTHLHLVQTIFRGLCEDLSLLEWLRTRVWPLEAAHDEASLRASTRLGLADLLLTGTTTILDMGTTHGEDAVAEEIARSGIRARFGKAMMDGGEAVPSRLREETRASLDESLALLRRWHGAADGRLGYAFAPRFALSCSRELLEAVARVAEDEGALVHTHSNENAAERALIERATGRSPVGYLAEVGVASDRAIFAHGVHLDPEERRLLAERGTAIAHCPSSNLKLGSGIADIVALRAAGITVALGADGAACNNCLDALEEARLASLLARAAHGPGALGAHEALLLATRDGAKALRLEGEIGTLEVGKRADVVVLDAEKLAGPGGDPATRIVFGGGSRAVRDVIVDGRAVVRDGELRMLDAREVRARAAEELPKLVERAGI